MTPAAQDSSLLPELAGRYPDPFPPRFASAWGDDQYGLWADLQVPETGQTPPVIQRFRWIEPGRFLMGSPAAEPEREDREGPQHWVTLPRGFWLGETVCTQGLWQAVTGGNPSRFKGPDRPVEKVSWNNVQEFLQRLAALVLGCEAALPTEAEWEYACRAGTQTPFSFGATVTTDQANFDGSYPYAGGAEGQYRQETVAVRTFPPNPWGLYEMHGNIWEWCADGLRDYRDESETDPHGPLEAGAPRALRGGAWIRHAGGVRSAFRYALHPDSVFSNVGFRVRLQSIKPDTE